MALASIIILSILLILRKTLEKSPESEFWRKRFQYGIALSIALAAFIWSDIGPQMIWSLVVLGLFGLVAFVIYTVDQFEHKKYLIACWAPAVIVLFVVWVFDSLFPSLSESWDDLLGSIVTFSLIWGVGSWLLGRRQRKALEKERILALEKEKEYQITQEIRASLELEVSERTRDLVKQKEALQQTLEELKSTQDQLVHSEKMASLGELTAGIAHEIQNPLNFVNNFSEVSNELIGEIKEELIKNSDARDMGLIEEILHDLEQNLTKINTHGKRADSIVKGMLQHSRNSGEEKELTNVNTLADEYMRLSYHGLRAKDKTFNADFSLELAEDLPEMLMVPQDIGRVLLNLINNGFYAVAERRKAEGEYGFKPLVTLSTKKSQKGIEIAVTDNGYGIPKEIQGKIFQPFFTTKPTGSGTGLGLSMSYDIITKGHGGELSVKSQEGQGTTFTIHLPSQN